MKHISTYKICITALFAALICVATMLVQIPIPATGGYANAGDGVILISAFLMNPVHAVAAAGLGSLLADLLSGYASYAPGTLLIKAGVVLIAALVFGRMGRKQNTGRTLGAMILSGVLAEAFMVLGYFFYEAVTLGMGTAAAAGIAGNIGQGAAGVVIACLIAPVLAKSEEIRDLMKKTHKH